MADKIKIEIEIEKENLKKGLINRWMGLRSRARNILVKSVNAVPGKRDPRGDEEFKACLFQARIVSAQIKALDPAWNPRPSVLTVPRGWEEIRPDGWQDESDVETKMVTGVTG